MKKINSYLTLFLAVSILISAQTNWNFDKSHTQVKFTVTHMLVTEVEGFFDNFDGSVITNGDNFENARISFTADINSINTGNERRDNHLKADDFFAADQFPKLIFKSKSFNKVDENNFKLVGDLTIKGITKEIELISKFNGIVNDPWGNTKAGFKLTGTINRFDYGLKWNTLLETGGAVVSEDVKLEINIQLMKAK